VGLTAEIFQSLAVSLWLTERNEAFILGASTSLSEDRARNLAPTLDEGVTVARFFKASPGAVDFEQNDAPWAVALRRWHPSDFPNGGNRVCVPMLRQGQLVGLITMGDRVSGVSFPLQDFDLLKCIADQAAAKLLNIQLGQRLVQSKELEAFQTMATFFVHDLKNAASTLNLTLQNLPIHFNDPAFRADALRGLGKTVGHINNLIGRLGQLRGRLELRLVATQLTDIVKATLNDFPAPPGISVITSLDHVPPVPADVDQLQKVILNLLINAVEACNGAGEIRLATAARADGASLSVTDTGCGMSPDFVREGLFRPFRTTKKAGLGIGMFQSKMIIDAHGGTIDVASVPGAGTTFNVFLPSRGSNP
jgi:putative PEP-CTERM system histidine kinase